VTGIVGEIGLVLGIVCGVSKDGNVEFRSESIVAGIVVGKFLGLETVFAISEPGCDFVRIGGFGVGFVGSFRTI